jgi:hypothetical protein
LGNLQIDHHDRLARLAATATDEHRYTQIRTKWRVDLGNWQIDYHDLLARLPAAMFILFLKI